MITYLFAAMLFCAVFSAFVAAGKGRSKVGWFLVGLIPVVGVVGVLLAPHAESRRGRLSPASEQSERRSRRPRRCSGTYIPDCRGCPYFRRPLFDRSYGDGRPGYCEYFHKELRAEQEETTVGASDGERPPQ